MQKYVFGQDAIMFKTSNLQLNDLEPTQELIFDNEINEDDDESIESSLREFLEEEKLKKELEEVSLKNAELWLEVKLQEKEYQDLLEQYKNVNFFITYIHVLISLI